VRVVGRVARWAIGLTFAVAFVGLVASTDGGDADVDCGVAPVAALAHDAAACRDAGRGQTLGAVATGSLAVGILAGPGLARRLGSRGFVEPPPADGRTPVAALDERAAVELGRRRRRARRIVLGGFALLGPAMILAAIAGEDGEPSSVSALAAVLFLAAAGAGLIGGAALARNTRQRLVLEHHPWRRFALDYVEVLHVHIELLGARVPAPRPLLLVSEDGRPDGVVLTLAWTFIRRLGGTGLRGARSVDVAGPVPGLVVVRVPGHDALTSARPPWLARDERRWRRILLRVRDEPHDATRADFAVWP
jgi:hypothetical protein